MSNKRIGVYVHIPFCASKCEYCSFISKCASDAEIKDYIDFLCFEIKKKSTLFKDVRVDTIYFGGGTPSYINAEYIAKILYEIKKNYY